MPKFEYDKTRLPIGNNIRILSLAASKTFSDPIYVNLSVANLASPPIYEALSYCWGDTSDGCFIFCDGTPYAVTQNLESALRHLRQSEGSRALWIDAICINQNDLAERASQVNLMRHIYRNARRVVVWLGPSKIHSIVAFRFCERTMKRYGGCFDSDSSPLDSVEVSRLGSPPSSRAGTQQSIKHVLKETKRHEAITRFRTYLLGVMAAYHDNEIRNTADRLEKTEREAETGWVPTEETVNLTQKFLRTKVISARTKEEIIDPTGAEVVVINMLLGRPFTRRWIHQEETPDPTDVEVMAINILSRRPWFSRCWVFQEAALGREVLMLCGTRHIKWEALYLGMFRVLLLHSAPRWAPDKRFITGHRLLMNNLRLELHYGVQEEPFDLLQLLWDTRSLHATDPRDKVYSLLGLINQKEAGVGGLTPDYSVSVEECYKRATLAIMSYTRNLDVLITEQNSKSTLNLPSWVPDWGYLEKPAPLQIMGDRGWAGSKEVTNNPIYRRFRASGSDQYYTATAVNGDALKLSGYVFDTIIALERVMEQPKLLRLGLSRNSWKSDWVSLIGFIDSMGTYFDVFVRWEKLAFSRKESEYPTGEDPGTVFTMAMTTGIMDGPKTASTILKEWRWCLRWYNAISILRPFIISTWIYNFLMFLIGIIFSLYTGGGRTAPHCFMEGSRRLARTKKGYLALVPRHSIVGDEILLLRGGSVPFVVRATPHENGYNLIGPSYVHGIMNGEAWDSSLTGDITIF
ncbi:hypothetical protein NUW58_g6029 [Xylaria curta]|uniref:Uncharacterized protein n=1 Tax=Xylaria curta TaxID=42375 RepID=A0ACC1P1E3_9PEZI|nr:hypothetical protein NUW58_g6029 [Xylaria curta]